MSWLARWCEDVERALGVPSSVSTYKLVALNPTKYSKKEIDAWETNTLYQVLYYDKLIVKFNAKKIVISVDEVEKKSLP